MSRIVAACISLPSARKRWDSLSRRYHAVPVLHETVPLTLWPAVVGRELAEPLRRNEVAPTIVSPACVNRLVHDRPICNHMELDSYGALGCSLSHASIWLWLWSQEAGDDVTHVLVLEDDCCLNAETFAPVWSAVVVPWTKRQPAADIFVLGWRSQMFGSSAPRHSPYTFEGSHCYVVSRQGAGRLLQLYFPIQMHVDYFLSLVCEMGLVEGTVHPWSIADACMAFVEMSVPHIKGSLFNPKKFMVDMSPLHFATVLLVFLVALVAYRTRRKSRLPHV